MELTFSLALLLTLKHLAFLAFPLINFSSRSLLLPMTLLLTRNIVFFLQCHCTQLFDGLKVQIKHIDATKRENI